MNFGATEAYDRIWTDVTASDLDVLSKQLGRRPRGVLKVAQRCHFGRPQVVVNAPVRVGRAGRARPFPTLFWLTCPYLVKAVGALEGEGWVDRMRRSLADSKEQAAAMRRAHEAHARMRVSLCEPEAARLLSPDELAVLQSSGVGGMRRPNGVKCLHAHLADYLGRRGEAGGDGVNVVGRATAGLLLGVGVDLKGRLSCSACTGCALDRNRPIAAVDVGSNAVRTLVADVDRDERGEAVGLSVIEADRKVTRLGDSLSPTGQVSRLGDRLPNEAAGKTLAVLERFAERARSVGAQTILGGATAAVRESRGAEEFLLGVWERCGFSLRALPGDEEAELAFVGAIRSLPADVFPPDGDSVTVIDLGGGSTEVVGGTWDGQVRWKRSVPVGAVRLTNEFKKFAGQADGDADRSGGVRIAGALYRTARERFQVAGIPPRSEKGSRLVAVGGTAVAVASMVKKLSTYDAGAVRGTWIGAENVEALFGQLTGMSPAERTRIPGLDSDRADIILAGVAILRAAIDEFGAEGVTVSDGGLLYGLIWEFTRA